ncbi:hypothetical protein SAMN02745945_02587 [Peptoclostridium litorale DSM 5388]|uniref:Uncharacterized protein n=1 Tax=Peptoclostridium litorale DSM 5388 TaxID=1121324 RepID=A0A069RKE4_PEPLI|nr:hypothetical protein [Peptoclostridium litorale]KDR94677.1 hypothetical protein CLIT_14c01380 [Peptoclostridium litorale DSM 5388]SIO29871.1 hypothetical protein SAMN02745945_02587 [Peptoclostridium litorale DSM 5388]
MNNKRHESDRSKIETRDIACSNSHKRWGGIISNRAANAAVSMVLAGAIALSPMGSLMPYYMADLEGSAVYAQSQTSQMSIKLTGQDGDDGIINDAEAGVSRAMREMALEIGDNFEESRSGSSSGIRIYANGADETYKFEIQKDSELGGRFKIKLRETAVGSESAYKLQKFALYTLYIPEGTFVTKSGDIPCRAVSQSFITDTDEERISPTIKASWPKDDDKKVASEGGLVAFEFPYDVEFAEGTMVVDGKLQNASDFIRIATTPISPYIPSYNIPPSYDQSDSAENFNVYILGRTLVIEPKVGKLKDFANYTVELKNRTVYFKGSEAGKKIYNTSPGNYSEWTELDFSTGDMVESSYPQNDQEGVHVEPTIEIDFKYPVEFVEEFKKLGSIRLTEDGSEKISLGYEDIRIENDEKNKKYKLIIDVNDEGETQHRLRRNTLYKLAIDPDTVRFRDYPIYNEMTEISFITGSDGESPHVSAYTSGISANDDITNPESGLRPDGSIYVMMDRPVSWDKKFDPEKLEKAVKLYKIPKASEKDYDSEGVLSDIRFEYEYMEDYGMVFVDELMEEIPLESVEIGEAAGTQNAIKVTPKALSGKRPALDPFSRYKIFISKEYVEDENGYNMKENISEYIWTGAKSDSYSADWDLSKISASSIEKGESAPYTDQYKLHGVPAYLPYEGGDDNPIVLYIDSKAYLNQSESQIINVKGEGFAKDTLRSMALENVQLRSGYYPLKSKILYEGQNIDTMLAGQQMQIELDDVIAGSGTRFESQTPQTASVTEDGRIRALSEGNARINVITSGGELAAWVEMEISQTDVYAEHISVEYEGSGSNQKTKISIYPDKKLRSGTSYMLTVPRGTFVSACGEDVKELQIEFAIAGDRNGEVGIYELQPSKINFLDIAAGEAKFYIEGYNFYEAVDSVLISKKDDESTKFTISQEDIYFKSVNRLEVAIRGSVRDEILSDRGRYTGLYGVQLRFKDGKDCSSADDALELSVTNRPYVKEKYPLEDGFDEKGLSHPIKDEKTQGLSFARVVFDESMDKVWVNSDIGLSALMLSSVKSKGSSTNLVDISFIQKIKDMGEYDRQKEIEKYLLIKDDEKKTATLYIPVRGMLSDTEYEFTLKEGVITNNPSGISADEDEFNEQISWSARSQGEPVIGKVMIGSAPQDYDDDQHMLISGNFGQDARVYFGDEEAQRVEISQDGTQMKVYLPHGSGRLDPGVYDVRIVNDSNHEFTIYSGFTVVKQTDLQVGSQERVVEEDSKGDIVQSVLSSQGIIRLKPSYSDDKRLKLKVSELLLDPRSVRLELDADEGEGIGELELEYDDSRSVKIYGLRLLEDSDDMPTSISIGEADPAARDIVRKKILMLTPKSEFFQVKCENAGIGGADLAIPYTASYGRDLIVLRYDFRTRGIYEEIDVYIDESESVAKVMSESPGVFVVVEKN